MSQLKSASSVSEIDPSARRARKTEHNTPGRAAPAPRDRDHQQPAGQDKIRVLCVEDHAVLVEGLRAQFAIDGGIEIVGRLSTAAGLLEAAQRLLPNVVLLDIEMPGPDAFEAADRLKHSNLDVRIVVLSAHVRDAYIFAAVAAGASAYFAKSDELDDIIRGIREVARSPRPPFAMGPRVRQLCRPIEVGGNVTKKRGRPSSTRSSVALGVPCTLLSTLTPREAEVLRLIGKGHSRVQIAAQLCRSAKTVDGHQERIMKKLGIGARADLIRYAIREGLAQA